jgi:hypothetical protein
MPMILAALAVGLLTAFYFGPRPGVIAAAATALLCLVAAIIPGAKLLAYAILGAGLVGVCFVGPSRRKPGAPGPYAMFLKAKRTAEQLWKSRR